MPWDSSTRNTRNTKPLSERVRRKVLKEFPFCWLRIGGLCTGKSEQVHHVLEDADGGTNDLGNLVGVCKACHAHYSAVDAQERSVRAAWEWKRRPEKHPGVLD